jgi:hypothetical protein
MKIEEEQLVASLENSIEFYRCSTVWTFILGLLAGVCIFCGETTFLITEISGLSLKVVKVLLCSLIALTGIATGFTCRHRIRSLKDCRDKILMEFSNRQFFPKPVREGIITEMQVLFVILFVFSIVIICIHYPVPKLPSFLDSDLVRIIPAMGFAALCWISVCPERKNPFIRVDSIQDFLDGQKIRLPIRQTRRKISRTYTIKKPDLPKGKVSQMHTNRSVRP